MQDKGYQIIEPELIEQWLGTERHKTIMFALLNWLVDTLQSSEDKKLANVDIEVIEVTYVGSYPSIGVHYKNQDDPDLQEYIEKLIEGILNNKSALDFASYCLNRSCSWENER